MLSSIQLAIFLFFFICPMFNWPTKQNELSLDLSGLFVLQRSVRTFQRAVQFLFVDDCRGEALPFFLSVAFV